MRDEGCHLRQPPGFSPLPSRPRWVRTSECFADMAIAHHPAGARVPCHAGTRRRRDYGPLSESSHTERLSHCSRICPIPATRPSALGLLLSCWTEVDVLLAPRPRPGDARHRAEVRAVRARGPRGLDRWPWWQESARSRAGPRGLAVSRPHAAMTIFPWACPSPWYRRASATSLRA